MQSLASPLSTPAAGTIDRLDDASTPSQSPESPLECVCTPLAQRPTSKWADNAAGRAESLAPYRLRRVLHFIDVNFAADITLADLSQAAGSSQSHFSRAFRLATGLSPYRYVLRRRIEHACVLLTSRESLTSVSQRCGFHSERQFSVIFKQFVGVGPKRFQLQRGAGRSC